MIIDAHAHIFPAVSGYTGGETRIDKGGVVRWGDGTVSRLLPPLARDGAFAADVLVEYMDMVGVDRAVLLQGPFYGPLNDYVAQAVDAHPDHLSGVASSTRSWRVRTACTSVWSVNWGSVP